MPRDDGTYGFNKRDAEELLNGIGSGEEHYIEGRVRGGSGGESNRLYRFTLNEDMAFPLGGGGPEVVADADILNMDGTDTGIDANVEDPLGAFADLVNGDAGYCYLQGGKYYVIQAPCPAT